MEEALSFFRAFEVWIYLLLALGGLIYVRKFMLSWQELRGAGFGLERENAQSRLNQSASMLVVILTMAVSEFVLVSFVTPAIPGAVPLLTPTLNLLVTPTFTLPATTPKPGELPSSNPAPTQVSITGNNGCAPGQIEIIAPQNGQEVSGVVEVTGTANIPNFGFYKFEMKRPDEAIWLTIQAGNSVINTGKLGDWDTRRLSPGDYLLGLVVVDNQAKALPPCVTQLRVAKGSEETPSP